MSGQLMEKLDIATIPEMWRSNLAISLNLNMSKG